MVTVAVMDVVIGYWLLVIGYGYGYGYYGYGCGYG
jgi:hypothetical protein